MSELNVFGGNWTQDKLERLNGYLRAYMEIMKLRSYHTVYVDAFAGTGQITPRSRGANGGLFGVEEELDAFLDGSARVALSLEYPFREYLFIEKSAKKIKQLEQLKTEFPHLADRINIVHGEANECLSDWCAQTRWDSTRAVVFLDPYGMQVEWRLIDAIAQTKAIDLWLLVPIGIGVNRMLPANELPSREAQERLDAFFGTHDWLDVFYKSQSEGTLFGDDETLAKALDHDGLVQYFVNRLKRIFAQVPDQPLVQKNSRNVPMFLLCFAAENATGKKIANWLLTHSPRRRK